MWREREERENRVAEVVVAMVMVREYSVESREGRNGGCWASMGFWISEGLSQKPVMGQHDDDDVESHAMSC